MMRIQFWGYSLIGLAALLLLALLGGGLRLPRPLLDTEQQTDGRIVQVAAQPVTQQLASALSTRQIRVAPPVEVPAPPTPVSARFGIRVDDTRTVTKRRAVYLVDTATGQETRLGDDTGPVVSKTRNENYILWSLLCEPTCQSKRHGLYAHSFATGEDSFVTSRSDGTYPKIAGEWIGHVTGNEQDERGALFVTNLQTKETLTLTHELYTPLPGRSDYFGVSERLVTWLARPSVQAATPETVSLLPPARLVIYDLALRQTITEIKLTAALQPTIAYDPMYELAAGETVVTWSDHYGYDIVTGSFFTITLRPPDWVVARISSISPITEQGRMLAWHFDMEDGTQRYFQASLIDATPSTARCVEGQNLVQNGDLEDIATHNVWQQSGNPSPLIVNDLPPNSPQAGQWAIRLGRYSNAQPTIQQTLNIPSGVKHINLAFDVRASSWDIWGGDQLQVDLIDPVTNQSILATPVQWTNRQLASGGWIPLQVDIQAWPGIDTPLQLVFRAQTDWAFPTDFTVDNIRFITSCR